MNCPSRVDEPKGTGFNQNPPALAADLTSREDLIGRANQRELGRRAGEENDVEMAAVAMAATRGGGGGGGGGEHEAKGKEKEVEHGGTDGVPPVASKQAGADDFDGGSSARTAGGDDGGGDGGGGGKIPPGGLRLLRAGRQRLDDCLQTLVKFSKFIGPGFMISVAYIDPGNYATDVAAGASYRYKLLFIVLTANIFAVFLQSLCIKLGSVSGMNLAEACRAWCPRWLNIALYILAEVAIIATDIAEVIGTAIAINLLIPKIPLVAGCAISIVDVLIILLFYHPDGTMKGLRMFEFFVMALVLGVVICFCIQLSLIQHTSIGEVFKGYLPSSAIIESEGLYQACGILGATVMPHSLYLGSGIVQPRLYEYDLKHGFLATDSDHEDEPGKTAYIPSSHAISHCLRFSITELALSLVTFALFVNSAILITAGASLYGTAGAADADLFGIHALLSSSISAGAGTIFALALLLSGISAGIVCTIAGQMVCEGALNWTIAPWLRRLLTRSISIMPSIIIAGAVGRQGLGRALEATQVVLSVVLPFITAPLIYFTARAKFMRVGGRGVGGVAMDAHAAVDTRSPSDAYVDADAGADETQRSERKTPNQTVSSMNNSSSSPSTGTKQQQEQRNATSSAITTPSTTLPAPTPTPIPTALARPLSGGATASSTGRNMRNHVVTTTFAVAIWLVMAVMNVANLVLLGRGE